MKLTYRATFIVYEICIATLIFHATKKRIPVNTFYFLYPNVKFVFAKQCSFSLLRFFICIDVKPTISLTLIYCYELVISRLVQGTDSSINYIGNIACFTIELK